MDTTITPAGEVAFCDSCSSQVNHEDQFCTNCGYPLKGTEEDKHKFLMDRNYKEVNLDEANRNIKKSSYALFYIAGVMALVGLIQYGTAGNAADKNAVLLVNVILAAIFAAIGFWCRVKPLAAIISGAALYALIQILNAMVDPVTIVKGIIFKIFVVVLFIRGIKAAIEADKLKKDLNIER
jgi:hypothetical protein